MMAWRGFRKRSLVIAMTLLLTGVECVVADEGYFLNESIPVVYVSSRGRQEFLSSKSRSDRQIEFVYAPGESGILKPQAPRAALSVPHCKDSSIREVSVGRASLNSEEFDVIFHLSSSRVYQKLQRHYRGVMLQVGTGKEEVDDLASSLGVSCFPSRVRLKGHGPQRVIEFREGAAAFSDI